MVYIHRTAHLLYGEWLRGRNAGPKREWSAHAYEIFEAMGARAFANTGIELQAIGERSMKRDGGAPTDLTSRELRFRAWPQPG